MAGCCARSGSLGSIRRWRPPERPTVVLMHHPPFATGIAHMDRYGLRDTAAFAEIVSRNRQIERILCGHLHRAIDRRFASTVAGTAPSTAHQVLLDLKPRAPLQFVFEPPGYQLDLWREGAGTRQPHRDVRKLAWPLSVSRRRLSYRRAIVRSELHNRDLTEISLSRTLAPLASAFLVSAGRAG